MSNFVEEFKKGQAGLNQGLSLGPGLINLDKEINGCQKGMHYTIGASSKTGKSTLVSYGFIIQTYLDALSKNIPIEFTYFSFEMNRILQEYNFACYFLYYEYGITHIKLDNETYKNKDEIELSSKYLRGKLRNDDGEVILVKPIIKEKLVEIYEKWIIPLFGEYSSNGVLIKRGVIDFIDQAQNPTGLRNYLMKKAEQQGHFVKETYQYKDSQTLSIQNGEKIVSYTPNDENKYHIVITDTLRKVPKERGFNIKENVDKILEYYTIMRNLLNYSFVSIIHTNRNMTNLDNLKFKKDMIYPTGDDIKDSSNISEECDYLITMFNPNDDKYNLQTHFGKKIKDGKGNPIHPRLRTLHIVESRHGECPLHFAVEMEGNLQNFKQIAL